MKAITTIITVFFVLVLSAFMASNAMASTPRTFYANETDFIKIIPSAVDLDKDTVVFTFGSPLNEHGEWQTRYEDAGEYTVNITASDGKEQSFEQVLLVVATKNQAPFIKEQKVTIKETQTVTLRDLVEDPDGDPLEFSFENPFDQNGEWRPTYGDRGVYIAKFTVSDGEFNVDGRVEVTVISTNSPPTIVSIFSNEDSLSSQEGEKFSFFVEVSDGENDPLSYNWKWDNTTISTLSKEDIMFNFSNSGKHTLSLDVDDGINTIHREWVVEVEDVNRKPVISHAPITVYEGEMVNLNFPDRDDDGDLLTYSYEKPFVNGQWQTGYNETGEHTVKITVNDGYVDAVITVQITVLNVDRAPSLTLPARLEVREGEHLTWQVDAQDPDSDALTITVENAPDGSVLNQKTRTLTWDPSYDFITRRGGWWSTVLNTLRLEHYFLREEKIPIHIRVCGQELCNEGSVDLFVYNVDRAPVVTPILNLHFEETDMIIVKPDASDQDGDILHYTYGSPLDSQGIWKTKYDSQGDYTVPIQVSDGERVTDTNVTFTVAKKNRAPTLNIDDDDITVNEGQEFFFPVSAADPDGDPITVKLSNLPIGAVFNDQGFSWKAPYNVVVNKTDSWWNNLVSGDGFLNKQFNSEKEVLWLDFSANDTVASVAHPVKLIVKNVNQAPTFNMTSPQPRRITVHLNEPVLFYAAAQDVDNDLLTYTWRFTYHEPQVAGVQSLERVFVSPGVKTVTVTADDGRDKMEYTWIVDVLEDQYVPPVEPLSVVAQEPFTVKVYVIEHQ